jgi:hypothetical protein
MSTRTVYEDLTLLACDAVVLGHWVIRGLKFPLTRIRFDH